MSNFLLLTLSWFPYGKTEIIIDSLYLAIVDTELNQIKSLAQYLRCREHSGTRSQNHNQKVESGDVESLFSDPFSLPAWWSDVLGCCGGLGCGPGEGRVLGSDLPLCLVSFGLWSPLWGLRCVTSVTDVLTERLPCAQLCDSPGATERRKTLPLTLVMLSASWRKLTGKQNGPYLFLSLFLKIVFKYNW